MSQFSSAEPPWHPIPPSPSQATCKVHLLQAGGLRLPEDFVLLPDPDKSESFTEPGHDRKEPKRFYVPDYVFLIQHTPSQKYYMFDLGMRKDLENLPPRLVEDVLPQFPCEPVSPADILAEHGTAAQQPQNVTAVIFSHMHFDHIGDGAKAGFTNAELWVGPTCCTYARPGYPLDARGVVLTDNLPPDGSRKIVEAFISDALLEQANDKRAGIVAKAQAQGLYQAVELRDLGDDGWIRLGSFDRAFDVFGDGSAYLIDAPGHSPGHQMMLLRVKIDDSGGTDDDFVLLAGDCYHHPALLRDPNRTARPPYSKSGMHADADEAIKTMFRTKTCAEKENIWVLGAHDFSVGDAIASGVKEIQGLVLVNGWREKGWKSLVKAGYT
ncbi:beta-lactamase-like protein [Massariosphaeria phaeospora]|uniref:Beta-lactamase-like protein n=1 Tax=Massariosphaeria phaeospora TaxID=100035 RepID=A0A7C8M926_9PLEO|nr:beta-lactamase-like protein [Massariosphaeria phaeospora]